MLAFSELKGRVRDAWNELIGHGWPSSETLPMPDVDALLGRSEEGARAVDATSDRMNRAGRLQFGDLVANQNPGDGDDSIRFRVAIDPSTGAAKAQHLFALESPWGAGDIVRLEGSATLLGDDPTEVHLVARQVEAGLRWAGSIGGSQGIGFGRVHSVSVVPIASTSASSGTKLDVERDAGILPMALTFKGPFCVSQPQAEKNLFRSDDVVPGGVIKGAIAMLLRRAAGRPSHEPVTVASMSALLSSLQPVARFFSSIRVLHAVPCATGAPRPPATPYSLVQLRGGIAPLDVATLVSIDEVAGVPEFKMDWKDDTSVRSTLGQAVPDRSLRVRTAIDPTRRTASDSQLFAYEMIEPGDLVWRGGIDLTGILDDDQRASVRAALQELLASGLPGIGKAKTFAEVSFEAEPLPQSDLLASSTRAIGIADGTSGWIIATQTPCILANPERYARDGAQKTYDAAFSSLSDGALGVVRTFARERLAGGEWLYHTFQKPTGKGYAPYLLTEAGSVIVVAAVKGREEDAQSRVKGWLAGGLPLPSWAVEAFGHAGVPGDDWTRCPYIRQNGFGEIRVNMPLHSKCGISASDSVTERSL
jgi:hypothetical protein